MRYSRCNFRKIFCCAATLVATELVGCGNSCFVGFFSNGNGHVAVAAGSPPPPCSLNTANGTIRVIARKASVCELCIGAARADHVFVALRGIQFRPDTMEEPNTADWLEVAPQLAKAPRQIDLVGDSPEIIVDSANLPAGGYREVRLQFLPDSPERDVSLPAGNACGETRWNCLVMSDGHAEQFRLAGDAPELVVAIQSSDGGSFVILPDARMDLTLSLEPHQTAYFSGSAGWKLHSVVAGRPAVARRSTVEEEDATAH